MSKSVLIPDTERKYWECELNGVRYRYVAGSTQTVPDEVAALIDQINAMKPVEEPVPEGALWTMTSAGPGWVVPAEPSGGGDVVTCHLTVAWNGDDSVFECTAQDKSATEMETAYAAGKQVQALVTGPYSGSTTFTLCLTNTVVGSVFFGIFYNGGEVPFGEYTYNGMCKARVILGGTYADTTVQIEPLM